MKNTILLLVMITTLISCKKAGISKDLPREVRLRIIDFDKSTDCSSAHVDEYLFRENTVYLFDPGTCGADMSSPVVDTEGNDLGSLGGITGNTKINGEEFSTADFKRTVWKKSS